MAISFKFTSWNSATFDTIPLDNSSFMTVTELKEAIIKKKKLDKQTGLVITNAQSGEEYKDTQVVPKNSLVTIRLIPSSFNSVRGRGKGRGFHSRQFHSQQTSHVSTQPSMGQTQTPSQVNQISNQAKSTSVVPTSSNAPSSNEEEDDFGPALWEQNSQESTTASEEEKIKAIINGAADIPVASMSNSANPPQYTKNRFQSIQNQNQGQRKIPPPGYVCYRCQQPGKFHSHNSLYFFFQE